MSIQINLQGDGRQESAASLMPGVGDAFSFNQVVEELNRVLKTDLQPEYFENPYSFTQDWTQTDLTESRAKLGYEPEY